MVLAKFIKLKHGLYKSCSIECFEGIMLEPCLLQPCFHVAGGAGGAREAGATSSVCCSISIICIRVSVISSSM